MTTRTSEHWAQLFKGVKEEISERFSKNSWYLIIAAALSASPSPELVGEFFECLTDYDPKYKDEKRLQLLLLQLRDLLLKQVVLIGAPQVLMAFTALSKVEGDQEVNSQESQLNEKWNRVNVSDIHARGLNTIHSIYGKTLLHDKIFPTWGRHTKDIQFMELFTVYGMYLSDFEYLTALETEAIVLVTILCLGFRGPSLWHVRGLGRLLGARGSDESGEDMNEIKDCLRGVKIAAMKVVEFVGDDFERKAKIQDWPNVGDVKRDLGGWGENV